MATLETSPEANCDRQADRQNDKATYRGSSYRSAQKRENKLGLSYAKLSTAEASYH